jgi:hypothetical protein
MSGFGGFIFLKGYASKVSLYWQEIKSQLYTPTFLLELCLLHLSFQEMFLPSFNIIPLHLMKYFGITKQISVPPILY